MMTERRVARKMTLVLDRGVDRLDVRTASRLAASRRQALGMLGAPGAPDPGEEHGASCWHRWPADWRRCCSWGAW